MRKTSLRASESVLGGKLVKSKSYGLSGRRPKGNLKHQYAVRSTDIPEWLRTISRARPRPRRPNIASEVLCGDKTVKMHSYSYRLYRGYLQKSGPLEERHERGLPHPTLLFSDDELPTAYFLSSGKDGVICLFTPSFPKKGKRFACSRTFPEKGPAHAGPFDRTKEVKTT